MRRQQYVGTEALVPGRAPEDPVGNAKRPRIINDEDEDDEDLFTDEEEELTRRRGRRLRTVTTKIEEIFEEGEEEAEVDEEV